MTEHADVRVGPQGRVVIPARLRDALHLGPGEVLVAHVDGDRLVLERRVAVLDRLRTAFGAAVPRRVSLVDELLADRREDAAREKQQLAAARRYSVLDASALLAVLNREPGGAAVLPLMADAAISAVNWSEVVQKALAHGVSVSPADLRTDVEALGVDVRPFTASQAEIAASLWSSTKHLGLSLGDRACLALATEIGATAVTADAAWARLALSITVRVVR